MFCSTIGFPILPRTGSAIVDGLVGCKCRGSNRINQRTNQSNNRVTADPNSRRGIQLMMWRLISTAGLFVLGFLLLGATRPPSRGVGVQYKTTSSSTPIKKNVSHTHYTPHTSFFVVVIYRVRHAGVRARYNRQVGSHGYDTTRP